MAISETFLPLLLLAIWGYLIWLHESLKKKLEKKDKLIVTMLNCLPKLLNEEGKNITFYSSVKFDVNSEIIKIQIRCNNNDFIDRFYPYIHSLHQKGYKISVDNATTWTKKKQ